MLHVAEEWFAGFINWSHSVLGFQLESARFITINLLGAVVITGAVLLALKRPRLAWLGLSMAILMGLNGILHLLASIAYVRYSPGSLSGLLIYLPLATFIFKRALNRFKAAELRLAFVVAIALQLMVFFIAKQ